MENIIFSNTANIEMIFNFIVLSFKLYDKSVDETYSNVLNVVDGCHTKNM